MVTKNQEELKMERDVIFAPPPLKKSFASWLGHKPRASPCILYKTERISLLLSYRGTVIQKIWKNCVFFSLVTIVFFCIVGIAIENEPNCEDDDVKCRPNWFDEYVSPLAYVEDSLSVLATFVLVFYANHAYERFKGFYWECRAVQGQINNIALLIGCNVAWEHLQERPEMELWAHNMDRYLNLCHFLCHANNSPALMNQKVFTCPEGVGSVLIDEDILGGRLCNKEEYVALYKARDVMGVDAPTMVVLGWVCMLFDKGSSHRSGYFRENIQHSRMTSLTLLFQSNIDELRGSIAKIRNQMQLNIPLSYAQYMQILIDIVCALHPFVIVYKLNTEIIENTGYAEMDYWSSLPFTLLAQLIFVYFYQGILSLCTVLAEPLGSKEDPRRPGEIEDNEFVIEVRSIMNQTRSGTYCLFNAARMAPSSVRNIPFH